MRSSSVTVVVPHHNRSHLLADAVRSALEQGDVVGEVLVCDDGSTDGAEDVVAAFEDPRVTWLPGAPSGGPAVPRNRGVATAAGEWVAFLDSDDRWHPGKLDAQLARVSATGADLCVTNAYRVVPGESGLPTLMFESLPAKVTLPAQLRRNHVITSSVLARREVLVRSGGFPVGRARGIFEDYALWLRMCQFGPAAVVDLPLVDYRDEATASFRGLMDRELTSTARALADFVRWRRSQTPRVATRPREMGAMARQLAGLVAVREISRTRTNRPVRSATR